jgi:hypothetical protein
VPGLRPNRRARLTKRGAEDKRLSPSAAAPNLTPTSVTQAVSPLPGTADFIRREGRALPQVRGPAPCSGVLADLSQRSRGLAGRRGSKFGIAGPSEPRTTDQTIVRLRWCACSTLNPDCVASRQQRVAAREGPRGVQAERRILAKGRVRVT